MQLQLFEKSTRANYNSILNSTIQIACYHGVNTEQEYKAKRKPKKRVNMQDVVKQSTKSGSTNIVTLKINFVLQN